MHPVYKVRVSSDCWDTGYAAHSVNSQRLHPTIGYLFLRPGSSAAGSRQSGGLLHVVPNPHRAPKRDQRSKHATHRPMPCTLHSSQRCFDPWVPVFAACLSCVQGLFTPQAFESRKTGRFLRSSSEKVIMYGASIFFRSPRSKHNPDHPCPSDDLRQTYPDHLLVCPSDHLRQT